MRRAWSALLIAIGSAVPALGDEPEFQPPVEHPPGPFGEMVAKGERIFTDTPVAAADYVRGRLTCENCHLDRGRRRNSSPMWAAVPIYPQYSSRSRQVVSLGQRIQDCFRYSMNGKVPELGSEVVIALETYLSWLSRGAPIGAKLPGRGYPMLADADLDPSPARGHRLFAEKCALCHGSDGQGTRRDGRYAFPPLWGPLSYNWGAGMARVENAGRFIKTNMPFGLGDSLTDQEAWDVAAYIDSRPRPQDPRFTGSVAETKEKYHRDGDYYGQVVDGVLLGDSP